MLNLIKRSLIQIGHPVYRLIYNFFIIIRDFIRLLSLRLIGLINFLKIKVNINWKIERTYLIASIFFLALSIISWWTYSEIVSDLPNVNEIFNPPKLSTKILDRNGVVLYSFYENEKRSWIPLNKIPQSLIWATLAIEDKDFYQHHGISVKGAANALWYNLRNRNEDKLRGGSTITQQLVKNVFFDGEKTLKRKIKEAVMTLLIETKLSKQEILERYFNQVPYGGEAYGAQEASLKYFGKNVWEINMSEAAFLAGLPAAPSSYSPFGNNPELAVKRQKHVIGEMVNAGFIDQKKAEELEKYEIKINKTNPGILAPHFVFYIKNLLENKYGFTNLESRGLIITTTLDWKTQKMTQDTVKVEVDKVKNLRISNGAALVISPKNGDILAMVGSKDYNALDIDGKFNVTTALRQPGSSIKPINYLLAFENGKTLTSVIDDSPVSYPIKGQKPYTPQNYNGKYMGRVNLRTALASSLNIPSVKLLAENGIESMVEMGKKMGINSWGDRYFGLSLALGSGEVKMTELSQAYSIFANLGNKVEINPILKIENYLGENVYSKDIEKEEIFKPGYAFLINSVLSDNNARAPIFGLNSKLKIDGKTVAVKTGTTNSLKDNWCIGWTPSFLVATWVGNNDSSPMSWVASGVSGATPIWQNIMKTLLDKKSDEKWETPTEIEKVKQCGKEEYFIKGTEKHIQCPKEESS